MLRGHTEESKAGKTAKLPEKFVRIDSRTRTRCVVGGKNYVAQDNNL